jgi:hypothetical protein
MADQADHVARPKERRRKVIMGAALAGVVFVSTLAFAEWLASGAGEGYARAGTVQPLTTESATAAASLYPGTTGDLVLRVHNPNPFPVTVTSVTPNGTITSDDAACDAAGHGVTFAGFTGNLPLGAGATETFTLPDVLAMALTSANECQGALFTVPVSLNGGATGGTGGNGGDPQNCDDGNPLTTDVYDNAAQTCVNLLCDDGNPLTIDAVVGGTCSHTFVPDGTACDDGNPSTFDDQSINGVCVGFPPVTWYQDLDADTYGNPNVTTQTMSGVAPAGFVSDASDCDDTNDEVSPAATEIINGIDDDCDAVIDEGFGGP